METQTLIALCKSIRHWARNERVLHKFDSEVGAQFCALCDLFNRWPDPCIECPVRQATGENHCQATPYKAAVHAEAIWHWPAEPIHPWLHEWCGRETFRLAARDERLFLESLLPA